MCRRAYLHFDFLLCRLRDRIFLLTMISCSSSSLHRCAHLIFFITALLRSSHHCAIERFIFIAPSSAQASLLCHHALRFSVHCRAVEVGRLIYRSAVGVACSVHYCTVEIAHSVSNRAIEVTCSCVLSRCQGRLGGRKLSLQSCRLGRAL